jgi:hypothetical protein
MFFFIHANAFDMIFNRVTSNLLPWTNFHVHID